MKVDEFGFEITAHDETRTQLLKQFRIPHSRVEPETLESYLHLATNLPPEQRSRLLLGGEATAFLRAHVPDLTTRSLTCVQQLYRDDYRWEDGVLIFARQASLLSQSQSVDLATAQFAADAAVEMTLHRLSTPDSDPGDHQLVRTCRWLCPVLAYPLISLLHQRGGRVDVFVRRAAALPESTAVALYEWEDDSVDHALGFNMRTPETVRRRLFARHRHRSDLAGIIAASSEELVTSVLNDGAVEPVQWIAQHMSRVPKAHRAAVAERVLPIITANPSRMNAELAGMVYSVLGPAVGVELLSLGDEEVARSVARAWRWTLDDGIYDALLSQSAYVRRKMVPTVFLGDSIDFTDEEEHRLRCVVLPAMLRDRSKLVRRNAAELFEAMNDRPQELESSRMDTDDPFGDYDWSEPWQYVPGVGIR